VHRRVSGCVLTAGCSMPLQTNDHGVKWTELRQGREVLVSTDIIGVSAPSGRAGEGVRATLYKGSDTVGAKRAAARQLPIRGRFVAKATWADFNDIAGVNIGTPDAAVWRPKRVGTQPSSRNALGKMQVTERSERSARARGEPQRLATDPASVANLGRSGARTVAAAVAAAKPPKRGAPTRRSKRAGATVPHSLAAATAPASGGKRTPQQKEKPKTKRKAAAFTAVKPLPTAKRQRSQELVVSDGPLGSAVAGPAAARPAAARPAAAATAAAAALVDLNQVEAASASLPAWKPAGADPHVEPVLLGVGDGTMMYMGGVKAGKCEGHGVAVWLSGYRYEGEWKAGAREGEGTEIFQDGDRYTGGFKAGRREGQGMYTSVSGTCYTGGWKAGHCEGQGTLTFASGPGGYEGEWKAGKQEGQGTYTSASGTCYTGGWKAGKRHGRGVLTHPDGSHTFGRWKVGKRVRHQPAAAAAPRQPTPQPAAPSRSPHEEFKRAWGKKLVANGWRPDVLGGDESTTPEDDEALRNMEFNANI
jgi:hypothetical protein